MARPFLDANVLLRHLLQDQPQQSPRATAYLERIERGELEVRTADVVIFETVFTLQRQYRHPKAMIRDVLLPLVDLPGIVLRYAVLMIRDVLLPSTSTSTFPLPTPTKLPPASSSPLRS